jgi:1-acyl-sn-glycerol-3-phosphate acyltransferase
LIERFVRLSKGAYMGCMFATFAAGIALSLAVVLPALVVASWLLGASTERARGAIRALMGFWLWLMGLGGLLKLGEIRGEPAPGPCVLVANHPGLFDVCFLICVIPGLSVLAKRELVTKLPLGPIIRLLGHVVAPDGSGRTSLSALVEMQACLRSGNRLLLFAEGTRSPAGDLLPFKAGAFRVARQAGVPIQPIVLRNEPPFLPHEDKWYYPPQAVSVLQIEYWDPIAPPPEGQERTAARDLEQRYRQALQLPASTLLSRPSQVSEVTEFDE